MYFKNESFIYLFILNATQVCIVNDKKPFICKFSKPKHVCKKCIKAWYKVIRKIHF